MKNFEYVRPETIQQVCSLLSEYREEARLIAGGQSLMILMKQRLIEPSYLIDLKALPNLDYLLLDDQGGLKIGALTTHRTLETSPIVKKHFEVLSHAEESLASIQIRNYGTIAGNLCQADPCSDIAPPLIILGAKVRLSHSKGERLIALENFFADYYQSILNEDEMLMEIQIPCMPPNSIAVYRKFGRRKTDPPIVGGAFMIIFDSGNEICRDARLVLSGVGAVPLRLKRAENVMKTEKIKNNLIDDVARIASEEVDPISDVIASKQYKCEMVKVLVKRLIKEALNS